MHAANQPALFIHVSFRSCCIAYPWSENESPNGKRRAKRVMNRREIGNRLILNRLHIHALRRAITDAETGIAEAATKV